jgi:hypothetical protein
MLALLLAQSCCADMPALLALGRPACNQAVQFNILPNAQPVSFAQVTQFTNLLAAAQGARAARASASSRCLPAALTRRRLRLCAGGISRGADNRSPNPLLLSTVVSMSKPQIMIQPAVSAAAALRGGVVGAAAVAALIAALL